MPVLIRLGARGPDIADLQDRLNRAGPSIYPHLVTDGIFGPNSARRVEEFQRLNGLKVDGIVGPNTWAKLNAVTSADRQGVASPGAPPANTPPPSAGVLYLHAHDAPGRNQTFDIDRGRKVHHIVAPKPLPKSPIAMVKEALAAENMVMSAMVINTHGGGAGTVMIGGARADLGANARAFSKLKPHFTRDAELRIYACAFATPVIPKSDYDAWIVEDSEMRQGRGIAAMKSLASATGCVVKAGFGMQYGTTGGFVGPWVKCSPSGAWGIFEGRDLSVRERIGEVDHIAWSGARQAIQNVKALFAGDG